MFDEQVVKMDIAIAIVEANKENPCLTVGGFIQRINEDPIEKIGKLHFIFHI